MKKLIFLSIFSIFISGVAFSGECNCPCLGNSLMEIMVTKEMRLTRDNLEYGEPIQAYKIETSAYKPHHHAYYLDGSIITFVHENCSEMGKQTVCFIGDKTNNVIEESISKCWNIERIKGKKYIVHYHEGFRVYSSKDAQFVIDG